MAESKPVILRSDPHVVSLRYRVEVPEGVALANDPTSVEREFDPFVLRVTSTEAAATIKDHYATEEEARDAVEGVLLTWRILEELDSRGSGLRFVFEDSEIVDRDPQAIGVALSVVPKPYAEVRVVRKLRVPDFDTFAVSDDVEVMWRLYESYLRGHDRLLPMAYTCLTRLRYGFGSEKEVAKACGVSVSVLKKLSELATSGDSTDARKWDRRSRPRALTDKERYWVEKVVQILILRAGRHAADPSREFRQITLAELRSHAEEENQGG